MTFPPPTDLLLKVADLIRDLVHSGPDVYEASSMSLIRLPQVAEMAEAVRDHPWVTEDSRALDDAYDLGYANGRGEALEHHTDALLRMEAALRRRTLTGWGLRRLTRRELAKLIEELKENQA